MTEKNQSIVQVALPLPIYQALDYYMPNDLAGTSSLIGCRVRVPVGKRKLVGIITNLQQDSQVDSRRLKGVFELLDSTPILNPIQLKLIYWLSDYYHHPLGETIATVLPNLLVQGQVAGLEKTRYWYLTLKGHHITEQQLKRSSRQAEILRILREHPSGLPQNTLLVQLPFLRTALLTNLYAKGWISYRDEPTIPSAQPFTSNSSSFRLNPAQEQAAMAILQSLGQHQVFLLEGITGSGKTEVYLQIIEQIIAQKKQALVLVPEINLTPQTVKRFQQRFAIPIAVWHSGLTEKQRLQTWLLAKSNQISVIIGTRSAVFIPMAQPGIIIVDEEHDNSFKQQSGLRYSARDFAVVRGQQETIPVVLGSATPSLETLHNVQRQRYRLLHLPERAGGARLPQLKTLDIRQKPLIAGLSKPLLQRIHEHLQADNQVLIFLNRRGYAPTLCCHACGWSAQCHYCDTHVTLHWEPLELHCHHCGAHQSKPSHCPECASEALQTIGQGTQKLEQVLAESLPEYPIVRLDSDSTRRKGRLEHLLQQIQTKQARLLIGTQMLAKGHHFPHVTLVVILNADQGLFNPDFRATEHLAQLLIQVAGRAGRAQQPGEVIIQTHQPDHPLLQILLQAGYRGFAQMALAERQQAHLPPYTYQALLRVESKQLADGLTFLHEVKQHLSEGLDVQRMSQPARSYSAVELLGPVTAPLARKSNFFHTQLLLQSQRRKLLHAHLNRLTAYIKQNPARHRVRWSLDVDPISMF